MVEEGHNQPNISPKSIKFQETMEKGEEDRISELPDCLLIDILSRLPSTKDVIRISTLSKRWKHLWTLLPNIIFEHEDNGNVPWSYFASFVDKTLTQRPQLNLKKFVLDVFCDIQHNSEVNNWIRYAIRCNVEELNLALWCCCDKDELSLDQSFISNACFTDLALCGCELYSSGAISWKKLKRLCISYVDNLDEDLIEKIFLGSPLLETLELSNCSGVWRLNITSKSVKNLVLYEYNGWLFDSVEIKAPNFLSLTIEGRMWLSEILLVNVSSLVEANLDYTLKYDERMPKEAEEKMLLRLILNLRHVKDLRIGSSSSKVLSRLEAEGFIIPSNVKIPDGFHERLELGDA